MCFILTYCINDPIRQLQIILQCVIWLWYLSSCSNWFHLVYIFGPNWCRIYSCWVFLSVWKLCFKWVFLLPELFNGFIPFSYYFCQHTCRNGVLCKVFRFQIFYSVKTNCTDPTIKRLISTCTILWYELVCFLAHDCLKSSVEHCQIFAVCF